jgi:hypothetical protein
MQIESSKRQFVGGALWALVFSLLLSFGAIYGLDRYLDPIDDLPYTTGSVHHVPAN